MFLQLPCKATSRGSDVSEGQPSISILRALSRILAELVLRLGDIYLNQKAAFWLKPSEARLKQLQQHPSLASSSSRSEVPPGPLRSSPPLLEPVAPPRTAPQASRKAARACGLERFGRFWAAFWVVASGCGEGVVLLVVRVEIPARHRRSCTLSANGHAHSAHFDTAHSCCGGPGSTARCRRRRCRRSGDSAASTGGRRSSKSRGCCRSHRRAVTRLPKPPKTIWAPPSTCENIQLVRTKSVFKTS